MTVSLETDAARLDLDASIIVALGGNLAEPGGTVAGRLSAAVERLAEQGVRTVRRSGLWRSAAWPDPADPSFLNAAALVETDLRPDALLAVLHGTEAALGRVRTGAANAPRPIDLDLVAYGREIQAGALVLPHPRAAERLFVMGPLAEIAPDWRHPVSGLSAAALARAATVGRDAARVAHRLQTDGDWLI